MSQVITGFVAKLVEKHGSGRRGPWTAYSAKILTKEGQELPKWFQFGFDKPACKEGDYVQFSATDKDANAMSVDVNTVRVSKNPPARPNTGNQSGGQQRSGGGKGGGARDAYWEAKDAYDKEHREPRIQYQAARRDAVEFLGILSANDGLPIPKAQGKASVAKRYEELVLLLDKLTVQFYHDTQTLRVLERVADAGDVDVAGDGDLPDSDEFDGGDADSGDFGTTDDDFNDDVPFE